MPEEAGAVRLAQILHSMDSICGTMIDTAAVVP